MMSATRWQRSVHLEPHARTLQGPTCVTVGYNTSMNTGNANVSALRVVLVIYWVYYYIIIQGCLPKYTGYTVKVPCLYNLRITTVRLWA